MPAPHSPTFHRPCAAATAAVNANDTAAADALLDLPFEDLLQVEIRSAGKRAEQLRDIPASVSIVTREDIARYGWQTPAAVLRNVPGLFVLDNTEERFIGTRGAVGGGAQFLVNGNTLTLGIGACTVVASALPCWTASSTSTRAQRARGSASACPAIPARGEPV
jgi:outer membrane receptor for ferrienterochelin and colicin